MFMETDFATGHCKAISADIGAGPVVVDHEVCEAEFLTAVGISRRFAPEAIEDVTRWKEVRAFFDPRRDRTSGLSEQDKRDFKFLRETYPVYKRIVREMSRAWDAADKALDKGRHSAKHALLSLCADAAFDAMDRERLARQKRLHRAGFGWVDK